ncbi:flagellar export chaperone FliS [Candidatus Magnetaquicoccus inordinatus]|uniref:flagellar export chaperone FliS n=1 Tax=Candidatus Magnetaquicoccus inordinatus TaxID=2496818 RepID=UPI00187D535B|nr:flagellar export chaperone FliS [Candidatus Magnetaquicoccus inordinatus]
MSNPTVGELDAANLSPLEILIQLYEGAIRFLEQAATACEEGMVEEFKENLGRGQRIIEEFQRTLDFTQGSGVSNQLNDLYGFMLDTLAQANLTHDVQYIQQVVTNLRILLDGWRGASNTQMEG